MALENRGELDGLAGKQVVAEIDRLNVSDAAFAFTILLLRPCPRHDELRWQGMI